MGLVPTHSPVCSITGRERLAGIRPQGFVGFLGYGQDGERVDSGEHVPACVDGRGPGPV